MSEDRPSSGRAGGRIGALLVLLVLPFVVQAQGATSWVLYGLRTGLCVDFLIAPDLLQRTPFQAYHPVPASAAGSLGPVLGRAVEAADSLRDWYPSSICLWQADSSRTGHKRQRHKDRPVSVLVWQVRTAAGGLPAVIFTTEGDLRAAGDLARSAEVLQFEAELDVDDLTGQRLVRAQIDESRLVWEGNLAAEMPAGTADELWELVGQPPHWRVQVHSEPLSRRHVVGSLRVSGTGIMATALLRSPIRWVAEYWLGGSARFSFSRDFEQSIVDGPAGVPPRVEGVEKANH